MQIDASNWKRLIRLEWTYFAKAFGKELFRKHVRKGLISGRSEEGPYSKTKYLKKFVVQII